MANRVWQYHFGRGIVRSPNNFGLQGDRPTHPELLDWLAAEFVAEGWRLKPLHRLIMTSNAYRMSSRADPKALATDPANDLFWRFDMRRLTAEEIRDSILAVSGTLNLEDVRPGHLSRDPGRGAGRPVDAGQRAGASRRPRSRRGGASTSTSSGRSLMPILESFDVAETDRSTPGPLRHDPADPGPGHAQQRVPQRPGRAPRRPAPPRGRRRPGRAGRAGPPPGHRRGRRPRPRSAAGVDLIDALRVATGVDARRRPSRSFCLVVLNLNEFVYLD